MSEYTPQQQAVKQTIDDLIHTATNFDTEALEKIYHDQLDVIMIDHNAQLNRNNKAGFIQLFRTLGESNSAPLNTWAQYHLVQADEQRGHVVLSRKNNITGQDVHLTLSIDLIHEDGRWQVLREVIYLRPDTTAQSH